MHQPQIILASSSIYRQKLLQQLQLSFSCQSPDINETAKTNETATTLVQRLATEKTLAIALQYENQPILIIGSDQVATLEGSILSKPHTHENAVKQLSLCSGKKVTFLTGLCLFDCRTMTKQTVYEPFNVYFRQLTDNQIEQYLLKEQPYDCAGSFKMEGLGISLFEKLEGDDPNSLIGLPLITLNKLLLNASFDILA